MTNINELRQRLAKITRDSVSLGVGAGGFPLSKQKKKRFKTRKKKVRNTNIDDINKELEIREMQEDPDYVSPGQEKEWQDDLDAQDAMDGYRRTEFDDKDLQEDAERRR